MIRTSCAGMGGETVSVASPEPTRPRRAADRPGAAGVRSRRPGPGTAPARARRTCSIVTTPHSRCSESTTMSAPMPRSVSEPRSCSIGVSRADEGVLVRAASEDLADRHRRAAVVHRALDGLLAQDAEEAPEAVDDREPREAVAQEELVLGVADAQLARHGHRLGVHDVGDRDALEALGEAARHDRPARRLGQEPAEDEEPQAAERVAAEDHVRAEAHEDVREALADPGREARAAVRVARDLPRDRARDPPAVERERGDEVEHEHHEVDPGQPREQALDRASS